MQAAQLQRTQIYLSVTQQAQLAILARAARTTTSALIRKAVDEFVGGQTASGAQAARLRLAGAWAQPNAQAPSLRELRDEERQF